MAPHKTSWPGSFYKEDRVNRVSRALAFSLLIVFMLSQGCGVSGPQAQEAGSHEFQSIQASTEDSKENSKQEWTPTPLIAEAKLRPCPDRVDTARAAGLAGTVVGTIMGTAFGMPYLGLVYKIAGYAIGFATGNPCEHMDKPDSEGRAAEPSPNGDGVMPAMKTKQKKGGELKPLVLPSQPIKEETL